jgi:hypothetical protein
MDAGFGLAQTPKYVRRVLFGAIRQRRLIDHPQNVVQVPMDMARRIHDDAELRGADTAPLGLFDLETRARVEAPQSVDQRIGWRAGIEQRADRHVAANTRKRV